MSSRKRSKSQPPVGRRSRSHDTEQREETREPELQVSNRGAGPDQLVDKRGISDETEVVPADQVHVEGGRKGGEAQRDGHITSFIRKLSGQDKKVKLKNRIRELETELEAVESENKIYSDGLDALRGTLEQGPLSSCINLGTINVQVGDGSNKVIIVEQAKEAIAKLTGIVEELLARNAEIQHAMERSEVMLKENKQTMVEIKETVQNKSRNKLDVERLEKLVADATDNQTDAQVFLDGITALLESASHNRMVSGFESMPARSRRAVNRLVNKYEAVMGPAQFAKGLGIAIAAPLQALVKDASAPLDKHVCAKIVLEWTKNAGNTPEKFVDTVAEMDQMIVKEKTASLKEELLQKTKRASVASDQSFEGQTNRPARSVPGHRTSNENMQMQYHRDQMVHIDELSKSVMTVHEVIKGVPQSMEDLLGRIANVEANQRVLMATNGSLSYDESPKESLFKPDKTISFFFVFIFFVFFVFVSFVF